MTKNSIEKIFFEKNGYIQLSSKINNKDFDILCEQIILETNKFYLENLDKIKNLGAKQFFLKEGPLAILPYKKDKFSVVWSIEDKYFKIEKN